MEYATEIHKLLGLTSESESHVSDTPAQLLPTHAAPVVVANSHILPSVPVETHSTDHIQEWGKQADEQLAHAHRSKFSIKNLLVYPIVFLLAFGFFYTILNFSSIMAQIQGSFTKPQQQQQLGTASVAYENWIKSYYFGVSDASLLDPNNDNDHDGLSNMDEFILGTNPTVADSDGDSYPDGLEVVTGHNPLGPGALTSDEEKLVATMDLNLVNDRISYNTSQAAAGKTTSATATGSGVVAGASTFNTNDLVAGTGSTNIDFSKPGTISIPRLNIQAPLIWSQDPSTFETDLEHGVIHYPGTALPGQDGIIYISGHSSDYIWKKDPFAQIFTKLNYLKPGDDIFVQVFGTDGKSYTYRYQVSGSKIYKPDDQAQFIGSSTSEVLNLSTCWPIGTQANRLVVSAIPVPL